MKYLLTINIEGTGTVTFTAVYYEVARFDNKVTNKERPLQNQSRSIGKYQSLSKFETTAYKTYVRILISRTYRYWPNKRFCKALKEIVVAWFLGAPPLSAGAT
ncbi:hypothetical protein [Fodinibius sp.]|uniref:hypothetical protein n=1 Tax=Fodinibius sp. TaxID=1872440 RepID=UPI003565AA3D